MNYYSYGFKNFKSFDSKKHDTVSRDWQRLNNLAPKYLKWSENCNEVMFANNDSQLMDSNPFHNIYRFCKYIPLKDPAYFLHTMAALSKVFELRGGVGALNLDDSQEMHLETVIKEDKGLKTSDLVYFYSEKLIPLDVENRNRTPNDKLNRMSCLGVVKTEQNNGKKGGKGNHKWSLPELTMKKLLDEGSQADKDFERHLHSALHFFSRYHMFGEVGTFLLDRLYSDEVSPFRFKYEYFMHSLNDFNILDLLHAIENNKWCKIRYRHGIADFETEILCYPLEIRVSSMHGREYLMYYEPFKRSYTSLRVEFIESIEIYNDKKVKDVLAKTGDCLSSETVDKEISNAKQSLAYSWGVSTTKKQVKNAAAIAERHPVSFKVAYKPPKEYYIANRMHRECRFGSVNDSQENQYLEFHANVSDEAELRPWIRSFYSRIMDCEGMETEEFSLEKDVKKIAEVLIRNKLEAPQPQTPKSGGSRWTIPEDVKKALGNGKKAEEHALLFNGIFSVYYYIMAEALTRICSGEEDKTYNDNELNSLIRSVFSEFEFKVGQQTKRLIFSEVEKLLIDGGFLTEGTRVLKGRYEIVKSASGMGSDKKAKTEKVYIPLYSCGQGVKLYRDVVPISTIEIRWLKTIVGDSKINMFLSEHEISVMRGLLNNSAPNILPLPMDKINFFDGFHFPEESMAKESSVLATILEGIYKQKTVHIKYHKVKEKADPGKCEPIEKDFKPIVLDYLKRDNRFQGLFQDCEDDGMFIFNISGIETAVLTENSFDYSLAEKDLLSYRENNNTSVEIEFYNNYNTADRILTEFSPWEKNCTYDAETGLYKLKISYQKQDEIDILVRLLGYGAAIRFVDREHAIFKEIESRMNSQMGLIIEHRNKINEGKLNSSRI